LRARPDPDNAKHPRRLGASQLTTGKDTTMWNKPEYTEMRFGFEVTMYIANR